MSYRILSPFFLPFAVICSILCATDNIFPSGENPMYLMPQTKKQGSKSYTYYSIAESYREGSKIFTRILFRLGKLSPTKVEQIKAILEVVRSQEIQVLCLEDLIFSNHWSYLDVAVLNHQWEAWRLSSVFGREKGAKDLATVDVAKVLTFNRCLDPGSKSYASRWVKTTSLDRILKIDADKVNDDRIYRELPNIEAKKESLEQHLFGQLRRRVPENLEMVFYDLTSSHFEGTHCSLARPGRTKSCGFKSHKIVFSLVVDQEGYPFSWDVLEGNTPDVKTIERKIKECKERFGIEHIMLVFDRGMVSKANLELIEKEGYHYISALDKDEISGVPGIDLNWFKGEDPQGIIHALIQDYGFDKYDKDLYFKALEREGKRYVVGFNPTLFVEQRRIRQERIDRVLCFISQKNKALKQVRKSIGKESLTQAVSKKLKGLKSFYKPQFEPLTYQITKTSKKGTQVKTIHSFQISFEVHAEKLAQAKLSDGVCVFITNDKDLDRKGKLKYPAHRVIGSYRAKTKVEEAFREIKSFVELNPIYVFKPEHVKAHYTLCVLAYLMNISITLQVKDAGTTSLKSASAIYHELSRCILGEFRAEAQGKSVYKTTTATSGQKEILSALNCEELLQKSYLKKLGIS